MKKKIFLIIWILFICWGGISLLTQNNSDVNTAMSLQSPNPHFWLGTDSLGRDLWVRSIQGGFVSSVIAVCAIAIAFMIGILTGAFSAIRGGVVDQILMRTNEIVMSLPSIILIGAIFISFKQAAILSMAISIGIIQSFHFSRWVRALIFMEKDKPYIESAKAMGTSLPRIFASHIWPNIAPQILLYLSLQFPAFILFETFVSFFGFGLQAPTPSWGLLLQDGWKVVSSYPHVLLGPAAVVLVMMFSVYQIVRSRSKILDLGV